MNDTGPGGTRYMTQLFGEKNKTGLTRDLIEALFPMFEDEVGDMPLPLQAKLLRALQEGEVEPLGSNKVASVDVRIIAATSRNLEAMIADGTFCSDQACQENHPASQLQQQC